MIDFAYNLLIVFIVHIKLTITSPKMTKLLSLAPILLANRLKCVSENSKRMKKSLLKLDFDEFSLPFGLLFPIPFGTGLPGDILNWAPTMPRGIILSDGHATDCCTGLFAQGQFTQFFF